MLATAAGAIIGWPFSAVLGWVMLLAEYTTYYILHKILLTHVDCNCRSGLLLWGRGRGNVPIISIMYCRLNLIDTIHNLIS